MSLSLFAGFGVELEYMLVDEATLDVLPVADQVLRAAAGSEEWVADVDRDEIDWSNELVLHVLEIKTHAPEPDLAPLPERFQKAIQEAENLAARYGARLLPTAMHPWMEPQRETRLWPHEASPIYEAFNRIFDCSGHGWSNLQSAHLNLPFADDEEFGRLHTAIRLALPLLPALAASSPFVEGRFTGLLDNRLEYYRKNSRSIPSLVGDLVPEPVLTRASYESTVLQPIYDDLAPHDPEGVLRHEFANARGAIARFRRGSIEIRLLDVQESPMLDLAIIAATVALLRRLIREETSSFQDQQAIDSRHLASILLDTARDGERTVIEDSTYLRLLGLSDSSADATHVWSRLIDDAVNDRTLTDTPWGRPLDWILTRGCLARRILHETGEDVKRQRLGSVYERLADCLRSGAFFE